MPITITVPGAPAFLTPQQPIQWSSDFIGPLPTGAGIEVFMFGGASFENITWNQFLPTQIPNGQFKIYDSGSIAQPFQASVPLRLNEDAKLEIFLRDQFQSGNTLDQGVTGPLPWDPAAGLGQLTIAEKSSGSGGLTPSQDQALQEIHQSTVVTHLLDALTLDAMSPPGGGPGPFSRTLLTPTAGILVRMTVIDPSLISVTPDVDYWLPSLAVIRLFRGADLWHRIPVHTSSKLYYWLDENVVVGATQFVFSGWLLNMSVQVDIRANCEAEVFILHYP